MRRYGHLGGTQSVPRVMRGVPVARLPIVDVPLSSRPLAGLSDQGIARTLGTLGGCTIGDIEMPEECMRPGEVLLSPGVCGQKPQPINPYATPNQLTTTGVKLQMAPAASASSVAQGMSRTTMLLAGIGAVGLIYYLGKRK